MAFLNYFLRFWVYYVQATNFSIDLFEYYNKTSMVGDKKMEGLESA